VSFGKEEDPMRHRGFPVSALILSILFLASCGGDGPTNGTKTSTTSTTTTVVSRADIDVEILNIGALVSGQGNLLFVEIRITESAGLGANINFARLEVFRATGELEERAEIGANDIIEGVGDNRLEAKATEEATLTFLFRATVKTGRQLELTLGFTDDNRNNIEVSDRFIFG
jgi:hypothetical protein